MNRRRLENLECHFQPDDGEPDLMTVVAEHQRLDRWLASIGMTAREALAAGMTEPPALRLRWTSLADKVKGQEKAEEYRRERGFENLDAGQGDISGQ